jgi:hypothetical protein
MRTSVRSGGSPGHESCDASYDDPPDSLTCRPGCRPARERVGRVAENLLGGSGVPADEDRAGASAMSRGLPARRCPTERPHLVHAEVQVMASRDDDEDHAVRASSSSPPSLEVRRR